ncbi:hypothetical protein [Thermus albus]|uniref:hypothetical protein n=1 Tax=Thermus albus TaxID=2908146 RepID=UPI001FAB1A67|nr:hypothetical protein [Thermus albus]
MRVERIQQVGLPGMTVQDIAIQDGILTIRIGTPQGEVVERYDLSSLGEEVRPGAEVAIEATYGALISAWMEEGEPVLQVVEWVSMFPEPTTLEEQQPDGE